MNELKRIIVSWSGGVDSTALIGQLLLNGWEVFAVTLNFYGEYMVAREKRARDKIMPELVKLAEYHGGKIKREELDGLWIWNFSNDSIEIPRRNKHILDWMIINRCMRWNISNVGMGEYIGADSWVVTDHVMAGDADHRAISAYVYLEYGIKFRFMSLADFGESRFKSDRLGMGYSALGEAMVQTTNCLNDVDQDCGDCYKCVERAAAFDICQLPDLTPYKTDPRIKSMYTDYWQQMGGE